MTAFVLAGLRLPPTTLAQLFAGVLAMRESSGYQLILAEGREEGAKKVLISVGRARFGPPDAATQALIDEVHDLESLEQLAARLEQVNSWQELLGKPAPRARTRRKK